MKGGKLDDSILKKIIFNNIKHKREEILQGSGTGIDSSIINLGGDLVAVTTDPITAASNNIGRLCVNICCNDIAASGAEPVAILVTLLMPYDYDLNIIKKVICEIDDECAMLNVQLAGGHTEKTDAVTRLVLVATVVGRKKCFIQQKVIPGDILIMTKSAGLEGSSIIAYDYEDRIKNVLGKNQIEFLKNLINEISVIPEGRIASGLNAKYMHDITEGGALGAAWEISKLAGCNVEVYCNEIFIYDEIKIICQNLNIDPLRLISSGSLLIAAGQKDADNIIEALRGLRICSRKIGKFIEGENAYIRNGKRYDLIEPGEDEIYKI